MRILRIKQSRVEKNLLKWASLDPTWLTSKSDRFARIDPNPKAYQIAHRLS